MFYYKKAQYKLTLEFTINLDIEYSPNELAKQIKEYIIVNPLKLDKFYPIPKSVKVKQIGKQLIIDNTKVKEILGDKA